MLDREIFTPLEVILEDLWLQPILNICFICWPLTCCLSWILGSSLKCSQLKLFLCFYFGRCSLELAQLVPLPYFRGRSTRYSDSLHDISVTIPRCYKDVYANSFFLPTARLWNSLPIECFPLSYDLNGFKPRINRHLFNCRFFLKRFPVCLNHFVFLFLVTPCLVVATQPSMEWIPILKKTLNWSFYDHAMFYYFSQSYWFIPPTPFGFVLSCVFCLSNISLNNTALAYDPIIVFIRQVFPNFSDNIWNHIFWWESWSS